MALAEKIDKVGQAFKAFQVAADELNREAEGLRAKAESVDLLAKRADGLVEEIARLEGRVSEWGKRLEEVKRDYNQLKAKFA